MTRNQLFPLRITPDRKEKEKLGDTFKAKSKEADKHCDKEENDIVEIKATFQSNFRMSHGCGISDLDI